MQTHPHPIRLALLRWALYTTIACCLWAIVALAAGCVMPGDLREIADAQERYQEKVALALERNDDQTQADIARATADLKEEVKSVSKEVEERTKGDLDALKDLGIPGAITAAGLAWLNRHRNQTRVTDPNVSNKLKA